MKVEENMYARTEKGTIFKVSSAHEIDVDGIWYKALMGDNVLKNIPSFNFENEIIEKADFQIEKLLKKGDYVNGYMITAFGNDYYDEELDDYVEGFSIVLGNEEQMYRIPPKDIKTVLTKEQFAAMQYEVK